MEIETKLRQIADEFTRLANKLDDAGKKPNNDELYLIRVALYHSSIRDLNATIGMWVATGARDKLELAHEIVMEMEAYS